MQSERSPGGPCTNDEDRNIDMHDRDIEIKETIDYEME
jgi:hypothetical protein